MNDARWRVRVLLRLSSANPPIASSDSVAGSGIGPKQTFFVAAQVLVAGLYSTTVF